MPVSRLGLDGYGVRRAGSFAGKVTTEAEIAIRNFINDIAVLTQNPHLYALTLQLVITATTRAINHVVTLTDDDITV